MDYGVQRGSIRINHKPMNFNFVELKFQHKKGRLIDIDRNPERDKLDIKKKALKKAKEEGNYKEVAMDFKEEEKF